MRRLPKGQPGPVGQGGSGVPQAEEWQVQSGDQGPVPAGTQGFRAGATGAEQGRACCERGWKEGSGQTLLLELEARIWGFFLQVTGSRHLKGTA